MIAWLCRHIVKLGEALSDQLGDLKLDQKTGGRSSAASDTAG